MSRFLGPVSTTLQIARGALVVAPRAHGFVLKSGWAFSFAMMADGQRQITEIHMPGDYVPLSVSPRSGVEGIEAATALEIETFAADKLAAEDDAGRVWAAFDLSTQTLSGKLRTWMTVIGRKPALARCAHLLCELHERVTIRDGATTNTFTMPLQQDHIGDAIGLTNVHVNRMLRSLRDRGLVKVFAGRVSILDLAGLKAAAGFDGSYLRATEETRPVDTSPATAHACPSYQVAL